MDVSPIRTERSAALSIMAASGYMQLFNFVQQIQFKIQFLSHISHFSSTQQPHVTTVLEGAE